MGVEATRTVTFPSGIRVPALGQGTWGMGEDGSRRAEEVSALRLGLDLGLTLVDTAEMYAQGGAEEVVGEAIRGRRHDAFLVSKVLPSNATRAGTVAACEASLRRLGTDHVDLYLLHWRGPVPLADTLAGMEALVAAGKVVSWGVSNLDASELEEVWALPGGQAVQTDQVLYNLGRRGIEHDLLPWCRAHGVPVMAYSPVEQGRVLKERALAAFAASLGPSPAQLALSWLLHQPGVLVIPKATSAAHVRENRGALDLALSPATLAALDRAFPRPRSPGPLEMI